MLFIYFSLENSSLPWYKAYQSQLIAAGSFLIISALVAIPTALAVVYTRNPNGRLDSVIFVYSQYLCTLF